MDSSGYIWPLAEDVIPGSGRKARGASNRLRVMGLIARKAELSQLRIANRLKLRACTVSSIVRELKAMGCVRDAGGIDADRAGPKERELELVPQYAWAIGVAASARVSRAVAVNLAGEVIDCAEFSGTLSMEQLADEVAAYRKRLQRSLGASAGLFCGVGLCVPGVVNAGSGTVLISNGLRLQNYPLRSVFKRRLKCDVWVNRDITCGCYVEHYVGITRERQSFIYFLSEYHGVGNVSLGASVVIDEKLFPGNHWGAGEMCLEAINRLGAEGRELASETLFEAEYRHYIDAIVLLVNFLDISCLVFSVKDVRLDRERLEWLRQSISSRLIPIPGRNFELLHSDPDLERLATGASLMAIHNSIAEALHA